MHKESFFIDNIFIDYIPHVTARVIILADGIPANKNKDHTATYQKFYDAGFGIAHPHYEGTWKSKGKFLQHNPVHDIAKVIRYFKDKKSSVYVIGASFGGGVVLTLDLGLVEKICVLSPVIDYHKVKGIENLEKYLTEQCSNNYRFDPGNLACLLNNQIIDPQKVEYTDQKKYLVLAGKRDNQISIEDIELFCNEKKLTLHETENGHITISKITEEEFKMILSFFSDRGV